MARGCFVTATDTGAGKTILCAALVASLCARGEVVRARKPLLTGLDDPGPHDHDLLALAGGEAPEVISPLRYGPAVSPHLAAQLAGEEIDVAALVSATLAGSGTLIVEGIGGLLVPIAPGYDVRSFAAELDLGVVIAARAALGTINHALLTLEAARAGGLDVRAVVLTPWPGEPSTLERSNRATIERLGNVQVEVLAEVAPLSAEALAAAGGRLPYDDWLA
jgi:dethiobiotin synthetase